MSGVLAAVAGGLRRLASFTVTIGGSDPYGYSVGLAGLTFGSISSSGNFTDANGNARTVKACADGSGNLVLALNGTNVPNTTATFSHVVVGGVLYQRAAATYSADSGTEDYSTWSWANGATNSVGTSGSVTLEVWG